MKKKKPVSVQSFVIHDLDVAIEIYRDRYGYHGFWSCPSLPHAVGGSTTHSDTIDQAIMLNEMNATVGIGIRLSQRDRNIGALPPGMSKIQ